MRKILIDTDVLINFTKGRDDFLKSFLEMQKARQAELLVNGVVLAEFFTDRNLKKRESMQKAEDFFGLFKALEIDRKTGLKAGELLREGKINFLGDALIAASCLIHQAELLTQNEKHFKNVEGLKFADGIVKHA